MFIIADEDVGKVKIAVVDVLYGLASGSQRVDQVVEFGNGLEPMVVSGYWVNEVLRVDIKVRK